MLYLNTGINKITAMLYESTTGTFPYYTFGITNKTGFQTIYFSALDNSSAPFYYNSFTVSLNVSNDPANGNILANSGEWTYTAYEMPYPNCLTMSLARGVLQTGIMIINATSSTINSYTGSNYFNIPVYNNI